MQPLPRQVGTIFHFVFDFEFLSFYFNVTGPYHIYILLMTINICVPFYRHG